MLKKCNLYNPKKSFLFSPTYYTPSLYSLFLYITFYIKYKGYKGYNIREALNIKGSQV